MVMIGVLTTFRVVVMAVNVRVFTIVFRVLQQILD